MELYGDISYRSLFELSGDAIMLLDESGFIHCNDATLKIFACPDIATFCSKHPSDISPQFQPDGDSSLELSRIKIEHALRYGYSNFQWLHKRLNQEEFYAEVTLSPAKWQGREVLQAMVQDISYRKGMVQQLIASKDAAEQAAAAKSEFLAVMSHEIRTPLHGIIGAQEILLESELDHHQQHDAALVLQSAKELLKTINNLLDFSKIEAGKTELELLSFKPADLLLDVQNMMQVTASEKGIALSISQGDVSARLKGDWEKIKQVLLNLVANAIKFTDHGSVEIQSDITSISADRVIWRVDVRDTGIGLSEEQQSRIFQQFSQADSSITRRYGGSGLGLSICKSLIQLMGGSLNVYSKLGKGATFSFKLSLQSEGLSPTNIEQDVPAQPIATRDYQRKVLVAEDNDINQKIILRQLQSLGIHVTMASNGLDAVKTYRTARQTLLDAPEADDGPAEPFDAILMDLQMPLMNGLEASKQILALGCTAPIIAVTADIVAERITACHTIGIKDVLTKPYMKSDLVQLLDKVFLREWQRCALS